MTAYPVADSVAVNNLPLLSGALSTTGSVSVNNVVQVAGTVTVEGISLSASFPSAMTVSQGPGSPDNPWYLTLTSSLPVVSEPRTYVDSSVTVYTASVINTTFLSSDRARHGAAFTNDESSAASVFLKLGANASTGSYTTKLKPGSYYEVPFTYAGRIDGVWDGGPGTLLVTEVR